MIQSQGKEKSQRQDLPNRDEEYGGRLGVFIFCLFLRRVVKAVSSRRQGVTYEKRREGREGIIQPSCFALVLGIGIFQLHLFLLIKNRPLVMPRGKTVSPRA